MKRFFLSALAATMLTVPVVTAQAAPIVHAPEAGTSIQLIQARKGAPVFEKKIVRKDRFDRHVVTKRTVTKRWVRGHRLPGWQRQHVVRDYRHYGLRRPGAGQHWVKINNDYLLVGIATGLIASVIAAN